VSPRDPSPHRAINWCYGEAAVRKKPRASGSREKRVGESDGRSPSAVI